MRSIPTLLRPESIVTLNDKQGLTWLASYPKSGNTWVRVFLTCLFSEHPEELDINHLPLGRIASDRRWVEQGLGIDISEFNQDEIDALRPIAYQQIADDWSQQLKSDPDALVSVHKVHDAYGYLPNGQPMFPSSASRAVVLLVRNPLDVAISYANHCNFSLERSADSLCLDKHGLCERPSSFDKQLRQHLGSWSDHTESWLDADIPLLLIRYEDLRADPLKMFTRLCQYLDLPHDTNDIQKAIHYSRFDRLKSLEKKQGFREKSPKVSQFFRKGRVGDWTTLLSSELVSKVIEVNRSAMLRLGYLGKDNQPLVDPLPIDLDALEGRSRTRVRRS